MSSQLLDLIPSVVTMCSKGASPQAAGVARDLRNHIIHRVVHAAWPPPTVLNVVSLLVELQQHVSTVQWQHVQQRLLNDLHEDDPALNSGLPGMVRCCLKMISVEVTGGNTGSCGGKL